ncbi:MAG TPA: hypothetical protein VK665_05505 [Candidatus Elarobacter sp.]|nr:hypothetical protein [Candidatus Elarobacter sp.]
MTVLLDPSTIRAGGKPPPRDYEDEREAPAPPEADEEEKEA